MSPGAILLRLCLMHGCVFVSPLLGSRGPGLSYCCLLFGWDTVWTKMGEATI